MKSIILATLLAMVSVNAYATNPPPNEIRNVAKGGKQKQKQRQQQQQNQQQTANGGSAVNEGVVQEVEVNNITPKQDHNTPDLASVTAFPTAHCRIAHGGSVVLPGFGGGYTSSTPDEVCELIELSKRMEQLNRPRAAILIMCEEPRVAKALGDECPPIKVSTETRVEVIKP